MPTRDFFEGISGIFSYGIIGFAAVLAILNFILLWSLRKSAKLNRSYLRTITISIIINGVLIIGVFGFETEKSIRIARTQTYGQALGNEARKAFMTSSAQTESLSGRWKATWSEYDDNGNLKAYTIKNPETGEVADYPPELITIVVNEAQISCTSFDETTTRTYWLEGRISSADYISLLYWSKTDPKVAKFTGVVFLKLNLKVGQKAVLEGWWKGYTRKGPVSGKTKWVKEG